MSETLLLRVDDAARALSVSRGTVYNLMARGELKSVNVGRSRRIPASAIADYVASLVATT